MATITLSEATISGPYSIPDIHDFAITSRIKLFSLRSTIKYLWLNGIFPKQLSQRLSVGLNLPGKHLYCVMRSKHSRASFMEFRAGYHSLLVTSIKILFPPVFGLDALHNCVDVSCILASSWLPISVFGVPSVDFLHHHQNLMCSVQSAHGGSSLKSSQKNNCYSLIIVCQVSWVNRRNGSRMPQR